MGNGGDKGLEGEWERRGEVLNSSPPTDLGPLQGQGSTGLHRLCDTPFHGVHCKVKVGRGLTIVGRTNKKLLNSILSVRYTK